MEIKDTGGPAFPTTEENYASVKWSFDGMTLRDYFAARALVAYFSDGAGFALQHEAAKWAYETADAMLEARK